MSKESKLKMEKSKNIRDRTICLLIFPLKDTEQECGQSYLTQYINILAPLAKEIIVITGGYYPPGIPDNVKIINVRAPTISGFHKESVVSKLHRLILAQFTLSLKLIQLRKKIDVVIIFMWIGSIFLPTLIARIQRKKIIVTVTGSVHHARKEMYDPPLKWIISPTTWLIERINYTLVDKIILGGAENMIEAMDINKYKKKIFAKVVSSYLDTERFSIKQGLVERESIIGYVGRLSPEKGVIEFAKAIPLMLSRRDDLRFLIVGDGHLMDEMKQELTEAGCLDKVIFEGWVPYESIPNYLNKMKIHVLPSYTEALGGSNLEAMACGAISIVSPAGGLPDVVIDGKTGFLLKDNSPQNIANKVEEVFGYSEAELEAIQRRANEFIKENFLYGSVMEKWRQVLGDLLK